jgi:ketosteroid isomerase-like protein
LAAENIDTMRRAYDAFNRGDIDTVMDILEPNVEWHEPEVEGIPFAGTHRGSQQVAENVFQPALEHYENFQVVPEEFLDAGERVVALGRFKGSAKATGRTLDAPFAHVWALRNGKAVSFRNYTDTAQFLQTLG